VDIDRIRQLVHDLTGCPDAPSDDTNLIALGFDSLLAVELFWAIERECKVELELHHLFVEPTIRGIAEAVARARNG